MLIFVYEAIKQFPMSQGAHKCHNARNGPPNSTKGVQVYSQVGIIMTDLDRHKMVYVIYI